MKKWIIPLAVVAVIAYAPYYIEHRNVEFVLSVLSKNINF